MRFFFIRPPPLSHSGIFLPVLMLLLRERISFFLVVLFVYGLLFTGSPNMFHLCKPCLPSLTSYSVPSSVLNSLALWLFFSAFPPTLVRPIGISLQPAQRISFPRGFFNKRRPSFGLLARLRFRIQDFVLQVPLGAHLFITEKLSGPQ